MGHRTGAVESQLAVNDCAPGFRSVGGIRLSHAPGRAGCSQTFKRTGL